MFTKFHSKHAVSCCQQEVWLDLPVSELLKPDFGRAQKLHCVSLDCVSAYMLLCISAETIPLFQPRLMSHTFWDSVTLSCFFLPKSHDWIIQIFTIKINVLSVEYKLMKKSLRCVHGGYFLQWTDQNPKIFNSLTHESKY